MTLRVAFSSSYIFICTDHESQVVNVIILLDLAVAIIFVNLQNPKRV